MFQFDQFIPYCLHIVAMLIVNLCLNGGHRSILLKLEFKWSVDIATMCKCKSKLIKLKYYRPKVKFSQNISMQTCN